MHRVTFFLDEVFSILHKLPQRHHGVVVNVELVIDGPRFHGNQHNPGIKLFLENLEIEVHFISVSFLLRVLV